MKFIPRPIALIHVFTQLIKVLVSKALLFSYFTKYIDFSPAKLLSSYSLLSDSSLKGLATFAGEVSWGANSFLLEQDTLL